MQNPKQIFASTLKYLRYKHHFSQEKLVIQMQIRGSTITREVYKFIASVNCCCVYSWDVLKSARLSVKVGCLSNIVIEVRGSVAGERPTKKSE